MLAQRLLLTESSGAGTEPARHCMGHRPVVPVAGALAMDGEGAARGRDCRFSVDTNVRRLSTALST